MEMDTILDRLYDPVKFKVIQYTLDKYHWDKIQYLYTKESLLMEPKTEYNQEHEYNQKERLDTRNEELFEEDYEFLKNKSNVSKDEENDEVESEVDHKVELISAL